MTAGYRVFIPGGYLGSADRPWATLPAVSSPTTQSRASGKSGGAYRDRTDDPLLAKQVLSQLS